MAAVRGIYRKFEAFFSGMGPTSTTHVNLLHSAATFGHLPMNSYHSHLYTTTHKQVSACGQDLVVCPPLIGALNSGDEICVTGCHVTVCKDIQDVTLQCAKTYRMSRDSV